MKPIETTWKGYRFRSRLEARWAVFFESIGVDWLYEPQGFENDHGRYLPDFQIKSPQGKWWVEVKGQPDWIKNNENKLNDLHDWGGVLPDFYNCGERENASGGLIYLGDIPEPASVLFVPVLSHRKGLHIKWRVLFADGEGALNLGKAQSLFAFHVGGDTEHVLLSDMDDLRAKTINPPRGFPAPYQALMAARSARFEHGEVPA